MSAESSGSSARKLGDWPQAALEIFDHPLGLWVRQGRNGYLARDWRLTPQVLEFIDATIGAGIATVIRAEHPKPNNRIRGVAYIAFSRAPHERWIVTLDQYSPASGKRGGTVRQFTVEQAYRAILESAGVPYRQERGGGKNLYVDYEHHRRVLEVAALSAEDVESAIGARGWLRIKEEIGFVTEALLETAIIAGWGRIGAFAGLELVGNQIDHMDIVACDRGSGARVIFELKRTLAGVEVMEQLRRYVRLESQRHAGIRVWGALLARDFTSELVRAVTVEQNADFPVALLRFGGTQSQLVIEPIASTWPRPFAG